MYKLMIVDDEYEIRKGLCNYFPWNDIGYQVVYQAENGKQALKYLLNNEIDIVLSDIRMPIMSGIELAKQVADRGIKTKIVFLSGHKDYESMRNAIIYGVKDFILKPTKYNQLVEVFTRLKHTLDKDFAKQKSTELDSEPNEISNYNQKIIYVVKEYVLAHYDSANLNQAAELIKMNSSYLSKFFKDNTGENFSDFLMRVKMEKAAILLKDIKYKTYEVSTLLGYKDPRNFTRTFKKYYGISPREFRLEN